MNILWFIGSTVLIVQMGIFGVMLGNGKTVRQNYVDSWRKVGTAAKGLVDLFTPEKSKRKP